jgi:iron complex transport system ATP-binding protein
MELFQLVRRLVDTEGLGALLVTHDVNLASRFADRVALLAHGSLVAAGPPVDVLNQEIAESVFGWPIAVSSFEGRPQLTPLRRDR